ncbi:MAG: O-antigen ligase family protein [Saprospiraceae bacterium]|nr:O-antigen ligase family protein [Saprospiraceae bacterium]
MASSKTPPPKRKQAPAALPTVAAAPYPVLLWLVLFGGSLFFWPACLDRYLSPRFFFASAALLVAVLVLWRHWRGAADWRWQGFDLLLLAWYGLHALSLSWAFSWSEGVFYTQKVGLLLGVYWLLRQALLHDEARTRRSLWQITVALTLVAGLLLLVQVGLALREHGLDNQHLYDYATGVFGNKGLASDFLFLLLILNIWNKDQFADKRLLWASAGGLLLLLLLLQTRTVYLAVAAAGLVYFPGRALLEPGFRTFFYKKIVPAGVAAFVVLGALIFWKGQGSSLAERLNPATYLESATANERRFVWYKTDVLNQDHFWYGVGAGSWKIWFPSKSIEGAYRLQEKNVVITRAHNDYLEIQAELGIIGALLFIALFVVALGMAAWAARTTEDTSERHDLLSLSAGLIGYMVIQYFDFPRERIEMQLWLGLLFAALAYYSRARWAALPGLPARPLAPVFLLLLSLGFAFNLWIGWNRMDGEIHNAAILEAQQKGNYPAMLREAVAASNTFYEYNDVVIPLAWYEGIAQYQMNQFEAAVAAFERANQLNPWAFQVLNNYGSALVQARRYPEAIVVFEKALAINPRYDEGKFNIAYSWYAQGDTARALEWLHRVDTIPNPPTEADRLKNKAVLQQKAEFEKAIRAPRQ